MSITAVGFDLDYTLAVPERDRSALLADATETVGAAPISREAYLEAHRRNLTGETREPIFVDLVDGDGPTGDLTRAYREAVNDALVPVAGVERMLADLRSRYRVGLLTNGPTVAQREKLSALEWEETFDAVVVAGEVGAGKPATAAFEALLDALGSRAAETAYVGDDVEADVAGASEAGLAAVQVQYPNGPGPHPRADAVVERESLAADLSAVLASL